MTDCFALLDETRRPWLDPDALKAKFLSLSGQTHPDRFHSAAPAEKEAAGRHFAELNAAYNCLREPRTQLQHLFELETGSRPADLQQIPPDLADLFMSVAALCRQADEFLAEKAGTRSPLLLAQLFERGQEWADRLMARQQDINQRRDALMARLRILDQTWMTRTDDSSLKSKLLEELQGIWRLSGFFARWTAQIQERLTRIAM